MEQVAEIPVESKIDVAKDRLLMKKSVKLMILALELNRVAIIKDAFNTYK